MNRIKCFGGILAGVILLYSLLVGNIAWAEGNEAEPKILAQSAIVIEASTGRVIWEKDADVKRYPASMTKIMTSILALENMSPHSEVFISPEAAETEDCPLGIRGGERVTMNELNLGMMLESDNGAAVALAEHMSPNVASFAKRMNEKAKEIGMDNTNFVNPNGLPDENHYSTARDMAKLARYAMEKQEFREVVQQRSRVIHWAFPKEKYVNAENTNKLLGTYEGITGIKTGWTRAAGGCLAASAKRDGIELIVVVMKSATGSTRFTDAAKLLDYGFSHVRLVKGLEKDRVQKTAWVKNGTQSSVSLHPATDVNYPLVDAETPEHYTISYEIPKVVSAPLKEGEAVGELILKYDGEQVSTIPMVADSVKKGFSLGSWLVGVFENVLVRI